MSEVVIFFSKQVFFLPEVVIFFSIKELIMSVVVLIFQIEVFCFVEQVFRLTIQVIKTFFIFIYFCLTKSNKSQRLHLIYFKTTIKKITQSEPSPKTSPPPLLKGEELLCQKYLVIMLDSRIAHFNGNLIIVRIFF